jgi:hypothetical protein
VKVTRTFLDESCKNKLKNICFNEAESRTSATLSKLCTSSWTTFVGGGGGILDFTPDCCVTLNTR